MAGDDLGTINGVPVVQEFSGEGTGDRILRTRDGMLWVPSKDKTVATGREHGWHIRRSEKGLDSK